jgi:hypothetical protein
VAGALTAAVAGVISAMDLADGVVGLLHKQWALGGLQLLSGLTGNVAAGFAFWAAVAAEGGATMVGILSLTGWGLVLAVALVALGMAIDRVLGDNFAQWLERSYWGRRGSGRYTDPAAEQADFNQAMARA